MSPIKSRKHAAARPLPAALGLMVAALPGIAAAQAQAPQPPANPEEQTLPALKATATRENDYKADTASSPKFTQPLVNTPQTITVIKKEILRQQGATSLTEALRNTPGITLQLGENGNTQTGDSIFMRGFDSTGNIFVDGMRDLGSISRDTFNVEQVEVVKGPSGSDNGRGASSGYVNLVSKAPQRDRFGSASVSLGTADRRRATADLNQPLDLAIPGSAVRLNFMAQDYGVPGRDEVKSKRWGIAPSLAFGLGTPTRTTFSFLHVEHDSRPDGGVSTYGLPGYAFGALRTGPAVDSSNYYGLDGDHDDVTVDMFTARIEHDLAPGYTLRNTTRLGRSGQTVVVTGVNAVTTPATGGPEGFFIARSRQGRDQNNEILTHQTNLSAAFDTGAIKHTLSTGVELIHERQRTDTPVTVSGTTLATGAANLYDPDPADTMAMPQYRGTYTRGSTLSAAVYAFDTLGLSERWLLNGGVRLERFHTETHSATFTAATATTPESLVQNPALALTDDLFSWKLGAVFKPVPEGSIYVALSNSLQPPGGANFALSGQASSQAAPSLDPQEGSNIEIGTKWDLLGGRLAATAAVYRSENRRELVSDGAPTPTFAQVGKRRVDGVELGLVGQLTPALNLSAGLAYMDSKIVRGSAAQQGGVIVFSPKLSFTSWATYKLPLGLTVGGGVRYVDTAARSSNVAAPITNLLTIPDYWVADAMVSYDVTKNLGLQLNLYNLFDKAYLASLNNGGSRYRPGERRNALLTASLQF